MKKVTLFLIIGIFCFNFLSVAAEDKWQVLKSTHFFIYYKAAPESFLIRVSDKAEEYYNKIADDLGFNRFNFWLWDERAKIYIFDNAKDYQGATGQPAWSEAAALPGAKIIQTFYGARDFFETTLPHEMGHIIFREFVSFNNPAIPLWLDEGVATFEGKFRYANTDGVLRQALAKGEFMDLTQLSQFRVYSKKEDQRAQVELFYLESWSLVNFLINKFGKQSFVYFCQNLRDRKNLESALASSYNFSNLQELDQAWRGYIKNG